MTRYRRKRYCVLQVEYPALLTDQDQTYMCLSHGRRIPDVEFQENPPNGRRDTEEAELCSSSKVPFIIDRNQTYTFVRNGSRVGDLEFHEKSLAW
jgi:hypothetical protein